MSTGTGLVCVSDYEAYAKAVLSRNASTYYNVGANEERTLLNNKQSFQKLRLRPRMLRDVSNINMSTSLLGQDVAMPIGISPTAVQKLAHYDGELATARAATKAGICMTVSCWATTSIEDVAQCSTGLKWFQIYIDKNIELTKALVIRAKQAGYKALVITVDFPLYGCKYEVKRINVSRPPYLKLVNFKDDQFDPQAATWQIIDMLRSIANLPIILKGILTKEDVKLAIEHHVDGILVSNHGGRQLDTAPASIEALPEIVEAVAGRCEVYLDGGVRFGTDIFKALALGAKAVFIGRPVLWGLAYNGEEGVTNILNILKGEFELAMALMGCKDLSEISKDMVVHESYYSKL